MIGYMQVAFDKSGSAKLEKRYNKVKWQVYGRTKYPNRAMIRRGFDAESC